MKAVIPIALGIIAVLVISGCVLSNQVRVDTGAMEPTIKKGDIVTIEKVDISEIKIGDIVMFKPHQSDKSTILRIIEIDKENSTFTAQGDANLGIQPNTRNVPLERIEGRVVVSKLTRQPSDGEFCEARGGKWQIWRNTPNATEECNWPTWDGGKECSDSSQCQNYCQAEEGSEVGSESLGKCYGWEIAICMQEVIEGVVQNEWCH